MRPRFRASPLVTSLCADLHSHAPVVYWPTARLGAARHPLCRIQQGARPSRCSAAGISAARGVPFPHSLQSLSRAFCLNEFKLKKGFKELFGDTVFGYIHSLRMQHARSLILDEKMNINKVAGKVGYKNANHFSTAFKKQFGIAPSLIK